MVYSLTNNWLISNWLLWFPIWFHIRFSLSSECWPLLYLTVFLLVIHVGLFSSLTSYVLYYKFEWFNWVRCTILDDLTSIKHTYISKKSYWLINVNSFMNYESNHSKSIKINGLSIFLRIIYTMFQYFHQVSYLDSLKFEEVLSLLGIIFKAYFFD